MLPPSSLIMRLHGYLRGIDSRVKKMEQEEEEGERERERRAGPAEGGVSGWGAARNLVERL